MEAESDGGLATYQRLADNTGSVGQRTQHFRSKDLLHGMVAGINNSGYLEIVRVDFFFLTTNQKFGSEW